MARCTDSSISTEAACTGTFTLMDELCGYLPTQAQEAACRASATGAQFPREWMTFYTQTAYAGESFDNMGRSLLVVFELVTGENWPVIMLNAVDGNFGSGVIVQNANPSAAIYFVLSQIIVNSFLLELFTSVVIDTYDRARDLAAGSVLLTASQQVWVANMRTLVTLEPATLVIAPDPPVRWLRSVQRAFFRFVTWRGFDAAVSAVIVTNIVFMMLRHAGQSQEYIDAISVSNAIFTALFGLEALLKVRLGPARQQRYIAPGAQPFLVAPFVCRSSGSGRSSISRRRGTTSTLRSSSGRWSLRP